MWERLGNETRLILCGRPGNETRLVLALCREGLGDHACSLGGEISDLQYRILSISDHC